MAKLKVFTGNLNGVQEARILASSKKTAAEIAGCSIGHFNAYFSQSADKLAAGLKPDTLYTRRYDGDPKAPWEVTPTKREHAMPDAPVAEDQDVRHSQEPS